MAGFKVAFERARVKVVVLNGVAGPQNVGVFKALHGAHQVVLHIKGQTGGNAVGVKLVGGQAFRLQKNLVAFFVCKAVDFVFNARAIARAHAFNLAGEHRAAVKTGTNDVMSPGVGVRDPARHLLGVHRPMPHKAEHRLHRIARLLQALRKINAAPVYARGRAGFQAALRQLELLQTGGQAHRGRISGPSSGVVVKTHMDFSVQKRAGCQHHGVAAKLNTHLRHCTYYPLTRAGGLHHQVVHRLLEQPQIRLVFQRATYSCFVQNTVGLRAGSSNRWPLGAVEGTKLYAALVRGQGHGATQGINFANQMPLANASNAGVAAHLPQGFDVVCQQQGAAAHARGRQSGFGSGVTASDHNHVKNLRVQHKAWGCADLEPKGRFPRKRQPSSKGGQF